MTYAETTKVPAAQTEADIKKLLKKYGADQIAIFESADLAKIAFTMGGRQIRFHLPLPTGAQPLRARWRALLLIIKAKLEAVSTGIVTFEDEFLAQTILPDGQTASDWMQPKIQDAYITGRAPSSLLLEGPKQ